MRLDEITDQIGKPTPSIEQIMNKHGISRKDIMSQLKKGTKVELDHTSDTTLANEIARDHLDEFPDYYDRLSQAEKK